jgi:hypothetical protein
MVNLNRFTIELIIFILNYDGRIKERNVKYIDQIDICYF